MSDSPIDHLLRALDDLDADAAMAILSPGAHFLTVDGRRAHGTAEVRSLIEHFLSKLRATSHRTTAQWHVDPTWVAEVQADYELRDHLHIHDLPRVFVLCDGPSGASDVRVYGAHERPLDEHRTGEEGIWVDGRWVPPL